MAILETTAIGGTGQTTSSGAGATRITAPGWLLGIGDSKTADDPWLPQLALVPGATAAHVSLAVDRGVGGAAVATTISNLAVVLAQPLRTTPPIVLMNFGANDVDDGMSQATWTADYLSLIDAVRALWPTTPIYLARAWRQGFNAGCDTLAAWIAALIPQRASLFLGMDERIWMKGADDGGTMSTDGIHYSAAGQLGATAAWAAVLWP